MQTVKLALRIYASEDESKREDEEKAELRLLDKFLKGMQAELESGDEEEKKEQKSELEKMEQKLSDKAIFDKIV